MQRRDLLHFFIAVLGAIIVPVGLFNAFPQYASLPRLLSVSEGMWQSQLLSLQRRPFSELKAPVDIAFDKEGIPHIVAQNEEDLYFAQGVLHAYFRLFEMDITTRVGQGRLSELLGARTVDFDQFFVLFGMRQAIADEVLVTNADPEVAVMMANYIKGVNAYIRQLSYRDLPIEYKILGAWPEEWNVARLNALLKLMTFRLSGRSHDLRLTRILQTLGRTKTEALFPEFLPANLEAYFIEPMGERKRDLNPRLSAQIHLKEFPPFLKVFEGNGSNSWAVGPTKSKTGRSILANDTHLAYSLPSVWFESQLLSPTTNVYGANFPGRPGIILGFNSKIAWGVTNGTSDAVGWTEVEFKDDNSVNYRFDQEFKPATVFDEVINVKNAPSIPIKVIKTDYGFVLHREKQYGLAVRWTGHLPSSELKTIHQLNHATSIGQCVEALKIWKAPVQNFTCADENNIAIYHAGHIPIWSGDQGWVAEPGIGKQSLWQGEIPFEELPHAVNPASGFVFSANERPVGPSYPYYLNWDFEEPFRGQRIKTLLSEKQKFDATDFMQMQNDVLNQHAFLAMPILLKLVDTKKLNEQEVAVFQTMKKWDFFARAKSIESSVFQAWWQKIENLLWKDLDFGGSQPYIPKKARTIWYFRQLQAAPEKWQEWLKPYASAEDLVTAAFHQANADLTKRFGADSQTWLWSEVQETGMDHIAKIPGLGSDALVMDGASYSLMANRGHHGPTWKLIVELGPTQRAWSQFAGGVTGNPLDPEYEKFVEPWSKGELRSSEFWRDSREAMSNAAYVWRWERN